MISCLSTATRRSLATFGVALLAVALVGLVGCGGSEGTMQEEQMGTEADTTAMAADTTGQMAAVDTTAAQPESTTTEAAPPSTEELLQREIEALKTENMQLRDKLDASEQSNKDLTAKVSDLEAAQIAAQEQAAKMKAEQAAAPHRAMPMAKAGASSPAEIQRYENGVALAREKKLRDAVDVFQSLLDGGIKADYADNCHYWIGLCRYDLRNYQGAIDEFKEVLKFRVSEKKDDAQIMLARSYERMGNKEQAMVEYRKLVDMYPTSEYVRVAQAKLK